MEEVGDRLLISIKISQLLLSEDLGESSGHLQGLESKITCLHWFQLSGVMDGNGFDRVLVEFDIRKDKVRLSSLQFADGIL